ncbi:protein kinase superfamily protein [Wolffia australiana]
MDQYIMMEAVGDGTCGSVYKAFDVNTREIVAIKKMKRKFSSWEECMNLREVKCLQNLSHPNIIKCKDIVWERYELFIILEFMEYNLYQVMRGRRQPFSEGKIRCFLSQVLQGLSYMHNNGYFHRDLKPENLLVTKERAKIADFGLAREVASRPPYTEYVSTRWYRAPEVLLQLSSYSPAIDMWAVGAILAEMLTLSPLFPGESEIDQLHKISCALGYPDFFTWPEGYRLWAQSNMLISSVIPIPQSTSNLPALIPDASPFAIDLITKLCSWDPQRRPTAQEALQHPFFHVETWISLPLRDPPLFPNHASNRSHLQSLTEEEPKLELNLGDFGDRKEDCFLGLTLGSTPRVSSRANDDGTPFNFMSFLGRSVELNQPSPGPLSQTNTTEGPHQNTHQPEQGQEKQCCSWIENLPLWSVYGG